MKPSLGPSSPIPSVGSGAHIALFSGIIVATYIANVITSWRNVSVIAP